MIFRTAVLLALCVSVAACSIKNVRIPRVFKVTVQQGNVITQEMIDQLKPGMTRSQVAFVMGEPVIKSTFDADRWDYIYTIDIPGFYNEHRRVSLYFERDVLAYFTGDYAPTDQLVKAAEDQAKPAENASGSR